MRNQAQISDSVFHLITVLSLLGYADGVCDRSWFYSPSSDSCIFISQSLGTRYTSAAHCKAIGAEPARIKDEAMSNLIAEQSEKGGSHPVYLGIIFQRGSAYWQNTKRKGNYLQKKPQWYHRRSLLCAFLKPRATGSWRWKSCNFLTRFVCEKDVKGTPYITTTIAPEPTAQKECTSGTYGQDCLETCSPNCGGASKSCNHVSGACTSGCAPGFSGPKCDSRFCPDQWITSTPSGTCIRLFTGNKSTWADARKICQKGNGDLVTILNKDTNELIGTQLQVLNERYAYIGLNDQRKDGTFQWLDFNDEVNYFIWDVDQTGRFSPHKNCTLIKTGTNVTISWIISDCEGKQAFVCEMFSDCENKNYGMLCPLDCGSTNCAKQACNPRTGVCQKGCISGFAGFKCDLVVEKNDITQAVAGHQNHNESAVHKNDWTQLAAGGGIFFNESAFENSTESPKVEKNETLSEDDVFRDPQMMVAYLSALLFAAVLLGFLLIPLCSRKNDVLEGDPRHSQEYEPEQLGDCEGDNGVSYYWEEEICSGDFWQEDFTPSVGSSISVYFPYWKDE